MSIKALQDYTYFSRYAQYVAKTKRREVWNEAVDRVRDMHLTKYADRIALCPELEDEIRWAFEQNRQKRVLGSQRALQFGGDPILKKNARIYNCGKVSTSFVTSQGVRKFSDFKDGDEVKVLTHKGRWMPAVVRSYGEQRLQKITVRHGTATSEHYFTADHRWLLRDGRETANLQVGDKLMAAPNLLSEFVYEEADPMERLYWCYGYVYGDGTRCKDENGDYRWSMVRLCGDQVEYRKRFEELGFKTSTSKSLDGDFIAYTGKYLKTLPDPKIDSPSLIRAFVHGYLDADGARNRSQKRSMDFYNIQATGEESISFIRTCFPMAGCYIVSESDLTDQVTNYGPRKDKTINFRIMNGFGQAAAAFVVEDVQKDSVEEVWCLEVEEDHSFVLPNGLVTGNCTVSFCDRLRFFQEAFWLLLCGSGVGFSVQKHHVAKLPAFSTKVPISKGATIKNGRPVKKYRIPDSIEGWADALGVLLGSYFYFSEFAQYEGFYVEFDYSLIRKAGSPLSSGIGKAPGPEPLRRSLELIRALLDDRLAMGLTHLRPIDTYDIIMHASDAVLSGGVRRSATICLFSADDDEMLKAKTGNWFVDNPQRGRSNNSVVLLRNKTTYEEFARIMESVKEFGEPGFLWTDSTELVVNPCVEIGMWPVCVVTGETGWSMCNLCELNGRKIKSREDFRIAARGGAIIGTLQAGYTDFGYLGDVTKRIVERESLLGVSITGMMDNPDILFDEELQRETAQYILQVNEALSPKLGVRPTARATCVKPAGTTSCVLGTASGIHPHHAKRYLRRIQANAMETTMQWYKSHNPRAVEKSVWSANGTDEIITFTIEVPDGAKTKNDLDAITLLKHVRLTYTNWVSSGKVAERCTQKWLSHNVSNTITVRPDEWDTVRDYIYENRDCFAGISLLPMSGDKDYQQAPMVAVYTAREIQQMYGDGSMMASGLIVDGLKAFDNNLWDACDASLGQGKPIEEPEPPADTVFMQHVDYVTANEAYLAKKDWVRRAIQFADRYFDGDVKKMAYCLKDVNNLKVWLDLRREHVEVDYAEMVEESDTTQRIQEWACSGGQCQMV